MVTYRFCGQMCNLCHEIYTVFYYCKKNNISYDNITFPLNEYSRLGRSINYIQNRKEFFINIWKYFKDPYYSIIKNIPTYEYNYVVKNKIVSDNIVFVNFKWEYPGKDLELFKELFYNKELFSRLYNKYNYIDKNTIGVHVRRTDFTKYETLENIYKKIDSIFTNQKIIIFSDDIEWCKNNIVKYKDIVYMEGNKDYEDLILLSMCNKIIKNPRSTFSDIAEVFNKVFYND